MTIVFEKAPAIAYHLHLKAFDDVSVGTTEYNIPQLTVYQEANLT